MAEYRPFQQTSPASPQSNPSIIDDLFDLAVSRDLNVMLGKALRTIIQILGAEAGSALFQAQAPMNIRSGAFRQEALDRIQRWEEVIRKRLQETIWNIPASAALPISISKLSSSQLILINVPLVQGTRVIGSLTFVLPPGSELSEAQRHLLARMAIGVGQIASLVAELQVANHRLHQISVFYDVGQALVTTFDIAKLLSQAMELAANVIDAGAASIMLVDEEQRELVFKVSHGHRGQVMRQQRIPLDEGIAGWVVRHGQPVIANDARADARFSHRVDVRTGFLTQSIAAVPLKIKGRIIGVLEVLNKYSGMGFNQEDIQLMTSIGAQAAIAIENARLYQEVCDERDQLFLSQDDSRRELTRKIQDGPMQLLSAISMSLEHLERLSVNVNPEVVRNEIGALHNLVYQVNRTTHNLLFELRPLMLETEGLVASLTKLVSQLQLSEKFSVHFRSTEKVNYNLDTSVVVYSIVQEALNNVRHHANADDVWLYLDIRNDHFIVIVRDNGQGFDVKAFNESEDRRTSFGITNMRDQAASIGAEILINSSTQLPHRGTIVQLVLSWPPQDDTMSRIGTRRLIPNV
jgi:signal transduction histidine kinase